MSLVRRQGHNIHGFTLIESIVVILIVSILSAISISTFLNAIQKVKCKISSLPLERSLIFESIDSSSPIAFSETLEGKIDCLYSGVDLKETITGTLSGEIPNGGELYLLVYVPRKSEYQFYYFPIEVKNNSWRSEAVFGKPEEKGVSFEVGVFLTDPHDQKWHDHDSDYGRKEIIGQAISSIMKVERE